MYYKYKLKTITVQVREPNRKLEQVGTSTKASEFITTLLKDKDADQEHFGILCLNSQNEVNGFKIVHSGGMQASTIDMKNIFRAAIIGGATAIICFHNHPSGNAKPSNEDESITKALVYAGRVLKIKVLDHVIVGRANFSFADEGLISKFNLDYDREHFVF